MDSEMKKLDILLEFTINHNSEHAEELKDLAQKARELGKTAAYDELMRGVEQMNTANETLGSALKMLRE